MEDLELLNSHNHAGLRMGATLPGAVPLVRIILEEIVAAAASCPLFFSKHAETGAFYLAALMGFKAGELLVDAPGGHCPFRPLEIEREGFFASGDNVAIAKSHPRFLADDGDHLFDADGQPSVALRRSQVALGRLMAGNEPTNAFIAAMLSNRLLEPVDINLRFDDGEKLRLDGLYTVSLDTLGELDDAAALTLFRSGQLQLAYIVAASLQQVGLFARRHNERLSRDS